MKGIKEHVVRPLEESRFSFAGYDQAAAEKSGYSDYSYWGSTFRCFLKNRGAVALLIVLALLLAFTCVQPYLPGQFAANEIIDHPVTEMQLMNIRPGLTNIVETVPAGTPLIVTPWENGEWAAVSNVLCKIPARKAFTVLEYGADYCRVEYQGQEGYVKNDYSTKLKLPDDYENTPYEAKSNFAVSLLTTPQELTNRGDALFTLRACLEMEEGSAAVTVSPAQLRLLPDTRPFLFGTNNAGQDLWALVWAGTRTSLLIGVAVALCQAAVGILIGVLWGYVRALDRLLTEIYNVIDNVPTTIVLILISYIMRPGVGTLIFAMSITGWVGMARFVRNQIVIIRDRDYNLASRCLGTGTARVITRNLLPYLVSVITLRMALSIPGAIGHEVFITYIGLGLPISIPSLGNLINIGRTLLATSASYQLVFPTIVLSIITVSFYIIGNAFADAADPKNHQ